MFVDREQDEVAEECMRKQYLQATLIENKH